MGNWIKYGYIISLLVLLPIYVSAQNSLRNYGNLKVFDGDQMGFHTNLVNDGISDKNEGLVGFYGETSLSILGAVTPTFYDFEVFVENSLMLQVPINIQNSLLFVDGDIVTPKTNPDTYVRFLKDAFYAGEFNESKINGYLSASNFRSFVFPVGNSTFFRPLIMDTEQLAKTAQCAYFFENPDRPVSILESFDRFAKTAEIGVVSPIEFWRLQGSTPCTVTLSWNSASGLSDLTNTINGISIVGWNIAERRWVNLGRTTLTGDLNQGLAISESFVPDSYGAITFGSVSELEAKVKLNNYFVSPNGDGINDGLVIPEMELSSNNNIKIFNRLGFKVFDMDNYTNEFRGISNKNALTIEQYKGLPAGIYLYVVRFDDLDKVYQGFLYLTR